MLLLGPRFGPVARAFGLCVALGVTACAPRIAPYRFHSPAIGGVAAADLARPVAAPASRGTATHPRHAAPAVAHAASPHRGSRVTVAYVDRPIGPGVRETVLAPPPALEVSPATPLVPEAPAPPRPTPLAPTLPPLPAERPPLLGEVGHRTDESPAAFAVRTLVGIDLGGPLATDVADAHDGEALLGAARAHDALGQDRPPRPGDLVFFSGGPDGAGALVGVVVAAHDAGTVEFVYVQHRVVRRGFVTAGDPHAQRDAHGAIENSFVRPYDKNDPADQKYLAGELLVGFARADRLVDRRPAR